MKGPSVSKTRNRAKSILCATAVAIDRGFFQSDREMAQHLGVSVTLFAAAQRLNDDQIWQVLDATRPVILSAKKPKPVTAPLTDEALAEFVAAYGGIEELLAALAMLDARQRAAAQEEAAIPLSSEPELLTDIELMEIERANGMERVNKALEQVFHALEARP